MSDQIVNNWDGSTFGPGQKVVIGPFVATNMATTPASNKEVPYGGILSSPSTVGADWVAPYDGRVIAASLAMGTAFLTTTGTAKFLITKNGTTTAKLKLQPSVGAGNLTKTAVGDIETLANYVTFTRGQRLGWRFTSGSTVNPATVEAYVSMVVEI